MMDKGIKQRLLGGVVLIAGAILLLPYVIENAGTGLPPKPQIPPQPTVPAAADLAPKLAQQEADLDKAVDEAHSDQNFYPVGAAGSAASGAAVAASAPAVAAPVAAVAATPLPVPDEVPPAPTPAVAATPTPPALSAKPQPSAAQVAQLAQAKAAKAAAKAAKAAAAKAQQEAAATAATEATKASAAAAAVDMPARPAAAKKPDADNTAVPEAWQVQVASLGTEDKARQLVAKLRKHGYHANAHASGAYWKVTVGPELGKDMAEALRNKLAGDSSFKLSGWVQAYRP